MLLSKKLNRRGAAERVPVERKAVLMGSAILLRGARRRFATGSAAPSIPRHFGPGRFDDLPNTLSRQPEAGTDARQGLTLLVAAHHRIVAPLKGSRPGGSAGSPKIFHA
jgi:hypothetical protein